MLVRVSTIKNLISNNSNSTHEIHSFSLNSRRRNHCYVVRYDFDSFASMLFNDNSLQGVNMAFRPGDTFDTYTGLCSCQWTFFVGSKTGFSCEGQTLALTFVAFLPNVISATRSFWSSSAFYEISQHTWTFTGTFLVFFLSFFLSLSLKKGRLISVSQLAPTIVFYYDSKGNRLRWVFPFKAF